MASLPPKAATSGRHAMSSCGTSGHIPKTTTTPLLDWQCGLSRRGHAGGARWLLVACSWAGGIELCRGSPQRRGEAFGRAASLHFMDQASRPLGGSPRGITAPGRGADGAGAAPQVLTTAGQAVRLAVLRAGRLFGHTLILNAEVGVRPMPPRVTCRANHISARTRT
jgi:hypothetical protein